MMNIDLFVTQMDIAPGGSAKLNTFNGHTFHASKVGDKTPLSTVVADYYMIFDSY